MDLTRQNLDVDLNFHQTQYVWDFWYITDEKVGFYVFCLNAPRELVATEKHHFAAQVGLGVTRNFASIAQIQDDVLKASVSGWDNTAIWSGDVLAGSKGFAFFYTSRDGSKGDGLSQEIGLAFSENLRDWRKVRDFRLAADTQYYETESLRTEATIHAWRDPFLFQDEGQIFMLLSAKARHLPAGRKGCVALLRCRNGSLTEWDVLPPLCAPGWYEEMEVPMLCRDETGAATLLFSTWAKGDHAPGTNKAGGFQAIEVEFPGEGTFERQFHDPRVLVPEAEKLYACRLVPELDGLIAGFDTCHGGLRRALTTLPNFQYWDRDFRHLELR